MYKKTSSNNTLYSPCWKTVCSIQWFRLVITQLVYLYPCFKCCFKNTEAFPFSDPELIQFHLSAGLIENADYPKAVFLNLAELSSLPDALVSPALSLQHDTNCLSDGGARSIINLHKAHFC